MPPDEEADNLGRPTADPRTILRALAAEEVEFLLIGGMAVIMHGHVRSTRDVDIIPNPSVDNMRRLGGALESLNAAAVDDRRNRLALDLSHPESLSIGNYFLITDAGGLDLLNGPRPDLIRSGQSYGRFLAAFHTLSTPSIPLPAKVIRSSPLSGRPAR